MSHPGTSATALPHGPPARFVETILERWEDGLLCRARIGTASPWAVHGAAPPTAGLEIAAQAAAWLEAAERAEGRQSEESADGAPAARPRVGYLVRVRHAELAAAIPVGAAVTARVKRTGGAPPLAIYEIEVRLETPADDAGAVCRATIGTYLTDESLAPSGQE